MIRYGLVRLTNSHAEPLRRSMIQLYEERDDAYAAGRDALNTLGAGTRLAIIQIVGWWEPRSGWYYQEAEAGQESDPD